MTEIAVIISIVSLLSAFWSQYQYYELRIRFGDLEVDAFFEEEKNKVFKKEIEDKVAEYGDFTERLLEGSKDK